MLLKIQKSDIKIPGFRQKLLKIQKKLIKKREKNVFVHTAKCLKAKRNHIVFFIQKKKQCFSMHFGFNNQFIKVKRILAKISKKTTKILFYLSLSILGMTLHVMYIPNM